MDEHHIPQTQDEAQAAQASSERQYRYQWNYGQQQAFDQGVRQKNKKKGALIYTLVLCTVILLCMGSLIGTLIWYQAGGKGKPSTVLTTTEVADLVKPSTVLILAYHDSGYSYGTGFFIRSDGYIATNYHVLGSHENYQVQLYSGEILNARLVGYREAEDLAVLKISGNQYPTVQIGNSDALSVGETAIAIGNPSGTTASWTTTQGIVSALERIVTLNGEDYYAEIKMIQTDAAVNVGNSGGPLCNNRGEVIGIVSRKLTDYENIGFALPINGAMEMLNAIVETGSADAVVSSFSRVRPQIGLTGQTAEQGKEYSVGGKSYKAPANGVWVQGIESNSLAKGVLKIGDLITSVDGVEIKNIDDLANVLFNYKKGDTVSVTVIRENQTITVSVVLGMRVIS